MAIRPSLQIERDLKIFGDNIVRTRKLSGLTASIVAERAGITRNTLRSIENGSGTARLENLFAVLRVLNLSPLVLDATEPLNTDFGRANAERLLPARVSTRSAS